MAILNRDVASGVAYLMNNTQLYFTLRENAFNGFCKALEVVNTDDEHILYTSVLQVGQDVQPKASSFRLTDIQPQKIFDSLSIQANDTIHSFGADGSLVTYLVMNGVQPYQRIDAFQWSSLPGFDVFDNPVGDGTQRSWGDQQSIEFLQMSTNIAVAHSPGIQTDHLLVQGFSQRRLSFGQCLWLEGGITVSRCLDFHRPEGCLDVLAHLTVTSVGSLILIQMSIQFPFQACLYQAFDQWSQDTIPAFQRLAFLQLLQSFLLEGCVVKTLCLFVSLFHSHESIISPN